MKNVILILSLIFSSIVMGQENKDVKVKKKKDGTNVYNFNFYHDKNKVEPKKQKDEVKIPTNTQEKELITYKPKTRGSGNSVQAGIFHMDHLSSNGDVAELGLDTGVKIGFVFMNPDNGLYFSPGFFTISADAEDNSLDANFMSRNYDGSAYGAYAKLGKYSDQNSSLAIDAGIEFSHMVGDLAADDFFGEGSYKFSATNLSIFGGPVFKLNRFLLSGIINLGVSQLDAQETIKPSGFTAQEATYASKKIIPFYGLTINGTFTF